MAKTLAISMRMDPQQQTLLNTAAKLSNMDRSSFILEAACRQAEQVLLDQRLFYLDEQAFDAFEHALETPVDNDKLKKLMTTPAPWEL